MTRFAHLMDRKQMLLSKARPYALPIIANVSIPTEVNGSIASPTFVLSKANLTANVLPALTFGEQLSSFLNSYVYLSIFIPLIFTSIVVFVLSRFLDIDKSIALLKFEPKDIIQIDATVKYYSKWFNRNSSSIIFPCWRGNGEYNISICHFSTSNLN
jgi:hypothetical protein